MPLSEPDGAAILELERGSRGQGSGLGQEDLRGCWRLQRLWDRQARPLQVAAGLLRPLAASLSLTPGEHGQLAVRNSVRLGGLEVRFMGAGELRGRRPLLVFWFDRLELRLGERRLWQRPLARPAERSLPFFALIASRREGEKAWLVARGRGGGLALWRREPLT
ncbi:hypothetical protein [Cyanobium sp. NIES-981]|uniref:hypothetical protein n=1 Tax=Cyanobium sp. NIES-981 TaxID=1851505 RepID=UPI000B35B0E7|nr:hypothetical protein [Cyanobium sp. NIES-981]